MRRDETDRQTPAPSSACEAYVERTVAAAPPLTSAQREKLAAVFAARGGVTDAP